MKVIQNISFFKLHSQTKLISVFVLVLVYLYTVFFTFIHNRNSEGYILGDWLIHYQDGGFKRRGLSGSFFFLLQDFTGFSLHNLVFGFQFILISFFFFTFYLNLKNRKIDILFLSLMLSSIGFVGLLNCADYVGKKEFILFAIFTFYVYLAQNNQLIIRNEIIIFILLFIGMFFHEIILFYMPYFLIIKYYYDQKIIKWKSYIPYILVVFLPAILIFLFGKNINEGHSLEILKERGVTLTKGIFFWNINEKAVLIYRLEHWFLYSIGAVISGFHIWRYISQSYPKNKTLLYLLFLVFVYSLPLFYVGLDWGRWLYIHMMMSIILFTYFLPKHDLLNSKIRNKSTFFTIIFILFSLIYRVELSGKFTFEGFFYRVFVAPIELLNKIM